MLARFARAAAPLRRHTTGRRFQSVLSAADKSNKQLADEIRALPNVDPEELNFVKKAGDGAYELTPVTDAELINAIVNNQVAKAASNEDEAEEEGFLDAVGLGPFHRRASLVVTGALTAISNEFYVMNEETLVALCLIGGLTTMHVLLREQALDFFNSSVQEKLKTQNEAEDRHIAACQTLINSQQGSDEMVEAVKSAFAEKEELVHLEAQAKAIAEKNKVAKDFESRLQNMVNRKAEEETKAYKELIDNVYTDVLETVSSDAKFQKAALKYAITAITTPEKAGVNPTVTLFQKKLKQ